MPKESHLLAYSFVYFLFLYIGYLAVEFECLSQVKEKGPIKERDKVVNN